MHQFFLCISLAYMVLPLGILVGSSPSSTLAGQYCIGHHLCLDTISFLLGNVFLFFFFFLSYSLVPFMFIGFCLY